MGALVLVARDDGSYDSLILYCKPRQPSPYTLISELKVFLSLQYIVSTTQEFENYATLSEVRVKHSQLEDMVQSYVTRRDKLHLRKRHKWANRGAIKPYLVYSASNHIYTAITVSTTITASLGI